VFELIMGSTNLTPLMEDHVNAERMTLATTADPAAALEAYVG
jgi:hypothetical protein